MSVRRFLGMTLLLGLALRGLAFAQTSKPDQKIQQGQQILEQARQALGGDAALNSLKSLEADGDLTEDRGERQMTGEVKLDFLLPDKFMEVAKINLFRGMSITRTETVNGDDVWVDVKRPEGGMRGGRFGGGRMGGGRMGGGWGRPGGYGGGYPGGGGYGGGYPEGGEYPGGGYPGGNEGGSTSRRSPQDRMGGMNLAESKNQIRDNFSRLLVGLFLNAPMNLQFAYDREDQTDQGKADVLKVTGPSGFLMNLFIDQTTHRPVLASYELAAPQQPRYDSEASSQATNDQNSETRSQPRKQRVLLYFLDYHAFSEKGVGEVWLPQHIIREVNGRTQEEWTIKKFKLNPKLDPKKFERKS